MVEELSRRFESGGAPMYLVLVFGAALLAAAVRYAWAPTPARLRMTMLLAAMTGVAGTLGLVTGLVVTFEAVGTVRPEDIVVIAVNGASESLMNPAFALILIQIAAAAALLGSVRAARAAAPA
jgi:predicted permease